MRLLLVALVLTSAGAARANGYGQAKQLILEAEALFEQGNSSAALDKLGEALKTQTTVDRKREPYGYAAYVFLRRAQFFVSQKKHAKAKAEIKKALRVKSGTSFVDTGFLVGRQHPFIQEHFPELTVAKAKKTTNAVVAPDALGVDGHGPVAWIAGNRRIYALERSANSLTEMHALTNDSLYRMAVHPKGQRVLFSYERAAYIYDLNLEPRHSRRLKRPFTLRGLYWDKSGTHAVAYTANKLRVETPNGQGSFEKRLDIPGKFVNTSGHGATYLRPLTGAKCHHYGCDSDVLMAYRIADGTNTVMVEFSDPDENRFIMTGQSYDPDVAIIVRDPRRQRSVALHRYSTGVTTSIPLPAPISFGRWNTPKQVRLSPRGDAIVYLRGSPEEPELLRVELDGAVTQRVPLPPTEKLDRWNVHSLDVLADNTTVLAHVGNHLWIVRGDEAKAVDLRPFSKKAKPEWAGSNTLFLAPNELFVGIEKGGSRYFMKVPLDPLLKGR